VAHTSLAGSKASGAAAGPIVQFRAAGAARDVRVFEVGVFAATAVAGEVGIGRPAAIAVTPATPVGPIASGNGYDNVSGAGSALVDTTWATAPTAPAIPWRRYPIPGTIGAGIVWTWPEGIVVPAGGALVIWQYSALAVTYDWHFSIDE
jgi:hypothetical protein